MGKAVSKVTGALGLTADKGAGSGAMAGASALQARAVRELEKIGIPSVEAQKIALEQPELVLSTLEERLGSSAMEDVQTDPRLMESQMKALGELEKAGEEGFTAEDKARFEALRGKIGSDEKARQATILQQMAQRGALDSGAQLAAQLGSSQAATQRASEEATQMAGQQAAARRGALAQAAQAAGQMQQSQFGQQSQKASAQDRISAFNASVAARDTGARQQHAQQKAQLANQQQMHNTGLIQQNFQNQMAKATGMSGALGNQAQGMMNQAQMQAQAAQQEAAGTRQIVLGGAGAAAKAFSDKNLKEDISPTSDNKIEEMLDKLKAYDYQYKDQGYREGEQTGIMAQDLEKSELGREFVEDTAGGKQVDYGKMAGTLAASLANVNDRLQKLEGDDFSNGGQKYYANGTDFDMQALIKGIGMGSQIDPQVVGQGGPVDFKVGSDGSGQIGVQGATLASQTAPVGMASTDMDNPVDPGVVPTPKKGLDLEGAGDALMDAANANSRVKGPQLANANPYDIAAMAGQFMKFADGGMNYESGGEGTIITSGDESYAGDELPDRINDGEMVLNLDQQDRITDLLQELAERRRGDEMVDSGEAVVNEPQQDTLMAVARGEAEPEHLDPEAPIVEPMGSTASDIESLLGELEDTGEEFQFGGVGGGMDQYIDPSFKPLPPPEGFMNGGIRYKAKDGFPIRPSSDPYDMEQLTSIPGLAELQNTQTPMAPNYMSDMSSLEKDPREESDLMALNELLGDQLEGQRAQDGIDLDPASQGTPTDLPSSKDEEEDKAIEYDPDPIEIEALKPEKKEDEELKSARRKDALVDFLDVLDKGLSHYDAANPNASLKPIKGGVAKSDFEKSLKEARRLAEAKDYKKRALDIQEKSAISTAEDKRIRREDRQSAETRRVREEKRRVTKDQLNAARGLLKDDPRFKKAVEQGMEFESVHRLLDSAKEGNQAALAALGTKLARAMGEVGVLTDTDVVRYVGGTSWGRKLKDWYTKGAEGELSEDTMKDIQDNLKLLRGKLGEDVTRVYSNAHGRMKTAYPDMEDKTIKGLLGQPTFGETKSSTRDPKIEEYAKNNKNMSYEQAKAILVKRGYNAQE